jgi:hypothetical protein
MNLNRSQKAELIPLLAQVFLDRADFNPESPILGVYTVLPEDRDFYLQYCNKFLKRQLEQGNSAVARFCENI